MSTVLNEDGSEEYFVEQVVVIRVPRATAAVRAPSAKCEAENSSAARAPLGPGPLHPLRFLHVQTSTKLLFSQSTVQLKIHLSLGLPWILCILRDRTDTVTASEGLARVNGHLEPTSTARCV